MILNEAQSAKDEFISEKKNKIEIKEWEEWWIENYRQ